MVEDAMPRNIATSLVVHQPRGSGSAMAARPQRLRCLIPACAFGPDHGDRDAGPFRLGHVARQLNVSPQWGIARAAPRGEPAAKDIKHGTTVASAIADQNGGSARVLPDLLE